MAVNFGVNEHDDLDTTKQTRLLNSIRFPAFICLLGFALANLTQGALAAFYIDAGASFFGLLSTIIFRGKYFNISRHFLMTSFYLLIIGMQLIYGDTIHTHYHLYTFIGALILIYGHERKITLILPFAAIAGIAITLSYGYLVITPVKYPVPLRQSQILDIIFSGVFSALSYLWLKTENKKAEKNLREERDQLNLLNDELSQAKIALEQRAQQMIHQSKMTAIGEMGSGLAHEINNPLTVSLGNLQLILAETAKSNISVERIQKYASMAMEYNNRIQSVVKALRHYSSDWEDSELEVADFQSILSETVSLIGTRFREAGTDLLISIGTEPVLLKCRPNQISQVLISLLFNSFEATKSLDDRWINIIVDEEDTRVKISVIDSGDGIPKVIQDKLMQPFFTTKEVGQGKGLGLSTARAIIDQHQGTLTFDSTSPKTCFIISLPSARILETKKVS